MMKMQMERKGVQAIMSTLSVLPPSQSLEENRVQGIRWRWKYNCDLTRAQKYMNEIWPQNLIWHFVCRELHKTLHIGDSYET